MGIYAAMRQMVWVLIAAIVILIAASLWVAVAPNVRSNSLPGPRLRPSYANNIILSEPSRGYAGDRWNWYNFTIDAVYGNYTWLGAWSSISNGTWGGTDDNTTLIAVSAAGAPIATFADHDSNWTSSSSAPVEVGQIIALKVDLPSMDGSDFEMAWVGPPISAFEIGSLPI